MNSSQCKVCRYCGRKFHWRKKWERSWDQVRYCSQACKSGPLKRIAFYKNRIMEKLSDRALESSICPSEALTSETPSSPKTMEQVRMAARHLFYEGKIRITQKGRDVDCENFKGPIRLKRKQ